MPRATSASIVTSLLALVLALGACTGSEPPAAPSSAPTVATPDAPSVGSTDPTRPVDAGKWTAGYCGAVAGWQTELDERVTALEQGAEEAEEPADLHVVALQFADGVTAATDQLAADVQALGTPPGPDGAAVLTRLRDAIKTTGAALREEKAALAAVEPDDEDALTGALQSLDEHFREQAGALEDTLLGRRAGASEPTATIEGLTACPVRDLEGSSATASED